MLRTIAGLAAALSLSLAPALAFAETSSSQTSQGSCSCSKDRGASPSATNPADAYDAPEWVRQLWSSP